MITPLSKPGSKQCMLPFLVIFSFMSLICLGPYSHNNSLHLHEIAEWLYSYFRLSVCVCVCVCLSICEQNADRTTDLIWTRFSLNGETSLETSEIFCTCTMFFFFQFHEIVEGLYFHFSLSVCVCLSVCPFVNKMPIELLHRF